MAEQTEWTVVAQEIEGSEDLLLPIPPDLMARLGWQEGDALRWTLHDGTRPFAVLEKVEPSEIAERSAREPGQG